MTEQKWFIYINDHHEGPFTPEQILEGIAQSRFPKQAFVWAEGMADWLPIEQVPDFQVEAPVEKPLEKTVQFVSKSNLKEEETVKDLDSADVESKETETKKTPIYQKREFKFAALFFILGVTLLVGYKSGLVSKVFVRLPPVPQVEKAEYQELQKAAQQSLSQGPSIAFAVSSEDQLSPIFFIATNLPSGTQFDLIVHGISHTLLNTLQFSGTLKATTEGHLAKTLPLRYPDGRAIPRGEYQVYIVESLEQSQPQAQKELSSLSPMLRDIPGFKNFERRVFFNKRVFLGQRDATYLTRLKEYHDRLVNRSTQEIAESKQVLSLLISQWETTTKNFERIKKIKNPIQKANQWRASVGTWRALEKQLQKTFEKFTKQILIDDVYHGEIYARLSGASTVLSGYHQYCENFILKASDVTEEQIKAQKDLVQNLIQIAQERLQTIENQPVDAYGLPARAAYKEGENYGG